MVQTVAIILGVVLLAVAVPWLAMGGMMGAMMGRGMTGGMGAGMLAVPIVLAVAGVALVVLGLGRHGGRPR